LLKEKGWALFPSLLFQLFPLPRRRGRGKG
jgi:hypothetical protein